ncbi:unnamed protein product [Brassica oleracea var. botrytis]|uniref:Reverse transcriptase zinc-binding domain-containing protein n=1 Tax=Brassica oleracea TaxID=3712 RepID=A0A3P6AWZ2_BRAOL|nr:unnamed protein product [Brassica oleracea]
MTVDSTGWDVRKVQEVIVEEDVGIILQIKFHRLRGDMARWGFSRNGIYDSKSGYRVLDSIQESTSEQPSALPPLEKQPWKDFWKTKTSPKLRHFLWRVMSGALAVKQQLSFWGIPLDPCCPLCHQGPESLCHMLFHCPMAKEVWNQSSLPLPQGGFSRNFVFLNIHYVLSCSKKRTLEPEVRLVFPWILWHIWKARNLFCFEQRRSDPIITMSLAIEEASVWLRLHSFLPSVRPEIVFEENDSMSLAQM